MSIESLNAHSTDWTRSILDSEVATVPYTRAAGFRGVYVGTSGNITVTKPNGVAQQYKNLAAGIYHPIAGIGISAATALDIVAGW